VVRHGRYETYVKVSGRWRYVYRAVDQVGQVLVATTVTPVEIVTDRAAVYPAVVEDLAPRTRHNTARYANNRVEADHGQLKRRLRPMTT
jgi:transposase, IS6 family